LFLDEVGDMSLRTQAKVLRVIEEQRFTPVGSGTNMTVDIRIIAATNKHLEDEIQKGNFREDLFYRLNVIPFYARRCANTPRIFRPWPISFWRNLPALTAAVPNTLPKQRWKPCWLTAGRAMCASLRIWWNAW